MMRTRLPLILLTVAGLLLTGCTAGTQESDPVLYSPVPQPRPSPSATVAGAPELEPGHVGISEQPIRSGRTVERALGPGWTRFESINEVYDLAFGPDDRLWAVTGGGLVAWDLRNSTYVRYELRAYHLAVAPDGSLWLTTEAGLCHFDGERCEYAPTAPGMGSGGLYDPVVGPEGTVWVGNQTGIWRFDGETWMEAGLVGMASDLAIGAGGDVWAATGAGVARSQPGQNRWQTYGPAEGLPDGQAVAIGVGQNEAWAAIAWEGVYHLDGERWLRVENPPGGIVGTIEVAADGKPWVGTVGSLHYPGGSLSHWDGEAWVDVSSQMGLMSMRAIAHGPEDVVASSTQRGLGLYHGGEWRLLRDGPTSGRVTSVAVTPDGAAWFAFGDQSASTAGSGLSRFDGEAWDYFLDDAEVGAVTVAPDGSLWTGSGCEVRRYDGLQWEVVGRCKEEIPTGNVVDIEFTSDGTAWVATGLGLSHYDGQAWTDYDKLANHLVAGPDGSLWVDGWEGSQESWYLARLQGETWMSYRLADAYPGGFRLGAVTADGRLWGMVEGQGLASFDGRDWEAASSWVFYRPPDSAAAPTSVLGASDKGALWMATAEGVARFVPPASGESGGTWTRFPVEDALGGFAATSVAMGLNGEMWFNNARLVLPGAD